MPDDEIDSAISGHRGGAHFHGDVLRMDAGSFVLGISALRGPEAMAVARVATRNRRRNRRRTLRGTGRTGAIGSAGSNAVIPSEARDLPNLQDHAYQRECPPCTRRMNCCANLY